MNKRKGVIALLTDFGDDYYVGVLHGVIASRAPDARVIDLTHRISAGGVAEAAYVLASARPYFPPHTTFCCVVDPGVGGRRRRIVARDGRGATFVAPDNGLLTRVIEGDAETEVRELRNELWTLGEASATFEGRSLFAPAAAALAAGAEFAAAGPVVKDPALLPRPRLEFHDGAATGEVVYVDAFGNLVTSIDARALDAFGARAESSVAVRAVGGDAVVAEVAGVARTFADVPPAALVAFVGSTGHLEIAVRDGSAAKRFGIGPGAEIVIRRADAPPPGA